MEENINQPEEPRKPGYLRDLGENLESGFSENLWSKIETQIPKKKKRRFLIWWWFAGLFLMAGLGLGAYYFGLNSNLNSEKIAKAEKEVIQQKTEEGAQKSSVEEKSAPMNNQKMQEFPKETPTEKPDFNGDKTEKSELAQTENKVDEMKGSEEPVSKIPTSGNQKTRKTKNKTRIQIAGNPIHHSTKRNTKDLSKTSKSKQEMAQTPAQIELTKGPEKIISPANKELEAADQQVVKTDIPLMVKEDPARESKEEKTKASQSIPAGAEEKPKENPAYDKVADEQVPKTKEAASELLNQKPDSLEVATSYSAAKPKSDSAPRQTTKVDSVLKKKKNSPYWSLELGLGSLFQQTRISDYSANTYSPGNFESNLSNPQNQARPTAIVLLQANRLWPVWKDFYAGFRLRGAWVYQEIQTELLPGKFSSSSFTYGQDSLSFQATSNAPTGRNVYKRTTWFADAGLMVCYKNSHFPLGLGIHWPLARFQNAQSGPKGTNGNDFQYFLRPPDVRLWFALFPGLEIYAESIMLNWGNYSLPLPVENKGQNIGLQVGLGWNW